MDAIQHRLWGDGAIQRDPYGPLRLWLAGPRHVVGRRRDHATAAGWGGVAGQIIAKDASGCVVYAPGKAVALVGIEDVVVVDTEDALLVMQGDGRSASVGEIVRELEAQGRDDSPNADRVHYGYHRSRRELLG